MHDHDPHDDGKPSLKMAEPAQAMGLPYDAPRVAMLCQGDELYGVGTVVRLIAKGFDGIKYVCFNDGVLASDLRKLGHEVHVVDRPGAFAASPSSLKTLLQMPSEIAKARQTAKHIEPWLKEHDIDLVHTHWLPQQLVSGFLRHRGYRTLWHIHNNTNPNRLGGVGPKMNHAMARWGASRVLPVSKFVADHWSGVAERVTVLHNAAEEHFGGPPQTEYDSGQPQAGGVAESVRSLRCVIAGRMDESKGHHVAVEAVLAARQAGYDIRLDLWGGPVEDNPYIDRLRSMIRAAKDSDPAALEAVRCQGFTADLRSRHRDYDLGLQCRIDPEPCSMWVCETIVDGLPLVASATGGTPELVDAPISGRLVPAGNARALQRALQDLADQPDQTRAMREAVWLRGQSHFVAERFWHGLNEIYINTQRSKA